MILTPEQIDKQLPYQTEYHADNVADTLEAYAEIVQKVAEWATEPYSCICGGLLTPDLDHVHTDDCLYIAARKLRGLE